MGRFSSCSSSPPSRPPPPAKEPEAQPRFQLVGFSSSQLTGESGVLAFTLACRQDFPESRICDTEEVVRTVAVPADLSGHAWARPVYQPVSISTGTANVVRFALDAAGGSAQDEIGALSCRAWRATDLTGMTVDQNGSFMGRDCAVPRAVACCALVP